MKPNIKWGKKKNKYRKGKNLEEKECLYIHLTASFIIKSNISFFRESLKEETELESPHKTIHILLLTYRRLSQYKTFLEQHKKAVEGIDLCIFILVSITISM